MRRTLFQKDTSSANTPGGASNGGEASPVGGRSSPSRDAIREAEDKHAELHEDLDVHQQITKSLKVALKEKTAQVDKFRQFLAEFDDSSSQPEDGSTPGFEEMMTNVHNKYRQQRSELERIRDEAGNLSQRYQDEVRERKNKTQQNGRLAERIFKAENALKGQDEMRGEAERLRHVNLDKESENAALRQYVSFFMVVFNLRRTHFS